MVERILARVGITKHLTSSMLTKVVPDSQSFTEDDLRPQPAQPLPPNPLARTDVLSPVTDALTDDAIESLPLVRTLLLTLDTMRAKNVITPGQTKEDSPWVRSCYYYIFLSGMGGRDYILFY